MRPVGLVPPGLRKLNPGLRLPYVQLPGERATRELLEAMLDPHPGIRLAKTTSGQSRRLVGPAASPQVFVREQGTNSAQQIQAGVPRVNARRLINKTPGTVKDI